MKTGGLTSKSNKLVCGMRFTGSFDQPDGFGSILEATVNTHGHANLKIIKKDGNTWSIILDNQQRKAIADLLVRYEPILFEEIYEN